MPSVTQYIDIVETKPLDVLGIPINVTYRPNAITPDTENQMAAEAKIRAEAPEDGKSGVQQVGYVYALILTRIVADWDLTMPNPEPQSTLHGTIEVVNPEWVPEVKIPITEEGLKNVPITVQKELIAQIGAAQGPKTTTSSESDSS